MSHAEHPARWEEAPSAIAFDDARILPSPFAAKTAVPPFDSLTLHIDHGHHTLLLAPKPHADSLTRLLLGDHTRLAHGLLRSPRPHLHLMHVGGRVYVRPGSSSLWDLLIFPHDKMQSIRRGIREPQLAAVLRHMDFGFLLQRASDDWGRTVDWNKVLGPGELYAVAICRMLYHSPRFALIDAALACLRGDQRAQLFAAARIHCISLVAMCDSQAAGQDPAFSYVLRPQDGAWVFEQRHSEPAFDADIGTDAPRYVWSVASHADDDEAQKRLQRRTSTLSQCSTTERRWRGVDATGETLPSRRQSAVISPSLTARSSVSDFGAVAMDTVTRMQSIESALAKYAASVSAATASSTAKPLKRAPLGGPRMFAAPAVEPASKHAEADLEVDVEGTRLDNADEHDELVSADTLTEGSLPRDVAAHLAAEPEPLVQQTVPESPVTAAAAAVSSPPPLSPSGRNPYVRPRAPRSYRRSTRSSFSSSSRTPPQSSSSVDTLASTQSEQDRRQQQQQLQVQTLVQVQSPVLEGERLYSRSPSIRQQKPRVLKAPGPSRIPRPPTSSSIDGDLAAAFSNL
ncbi:ATP-binding cassette sub- D member 1 [Coemansia erecta]|uniref:ATP-binding cassette sub- D member 1 n=1 Tax=Coemansia erecta TaxID=147472 RepID=A0A9W8CQZ0_9FUNG|nr:ATP-binding cassette sub- D member 1 [Coemansia erecta]